MEKHHIEVMLPEEKVDARIREIGEQISREYAGKSVHLICILKGSVYFTCELAKRITVPVTMDFMQCSSYGGDTKSSGIVRIVKDLDENIEGKEVIIIEDIIDSGRTLSHLKKQIEDKFVVGYGLDYDQQYRNLPYIGVVEFD